MSKALVTKVMVSTYKNGIVGVHIHTSNKWVSFSRLSQIEYEIRFDYQVENVFIDSEFLNPQCTYLCSSKQEKDQITFLYVPNSLLNPRIISYPHFTTSNSRDLSYVNS